MVWCVVPEAAMVEEHAQPQQVVELSLVPHILPPVVQGSLPGLEEDGHVGGVPEAHQACRAGGGGKVWRIGTAHRRGSWEAWAPTCHATTTGFAVALKRNMKRLQPGVVGRKLTRQGRCC